MKALIVDKESKMFIGEIPKPQYSPYQALVKMVSGGVCGTDLKILHGNLKGYSDYPTVLGHEGVGVVVEKGENVRNLEVGDYVLLPFLYGASGSYASTFGAFAEYGLVGDAQALTEDGYKPGDPNFDESYLAQQKLPPSFNPVSSCMIVTFREVYAAIVRMGFQKGQSVVVFGAGTVGLTFIKLCTILGLDVIAVVLRDEKVTQAIQFGARTAYNSNNCDIVECIKNQFPNGVNYIVDAAGSVQTMNIGLQFLCYDGKICCYGLAPQQYAELDWSKAPYNWTLQYVQWPYKKQEGIVHSQIITWMEEKQLIAEDFIFAQYPFTQSIEALRLLENGKPMGKIIITF